MPLHKNSPKRICFPDAVYYIVVKTQNNYPYFKEQIFCELFMDSLKICKQLKGFKLYAFSIIYDHINLVIRPGNEFNVSQIMKSLKENFSRNANIIMGYTLKQNSPFHAVNINEVNLASSGASLDAKIIERRKPPSHVSDTTSCRLRGERRAELPPFENGFYMDYDKINLEDYHQKFIKKYGGNNPHPKFKWLKSFYDHIIRFHDDIMRKEKDWDGHYDYTVNNQIKHGLPEDWHYTSINYSELIDSMEK